MIKIFKRKSLTRDILSALTMAGLVTCTAVYSSASFAADEERKPPPSRTSDVLTERVFNQVSEIQALMSPEEAGAEPDYEGAKVLLDELAARDAQEARARAVGHGLGQQRLARAGLAVEDHALGRLDANVLVELRVRERQLDRLLDLRDLLVEAADVRVALGGRLLHLHDLHERVRLVAEHADDVVVAVV